MMQYSIVNLKEVVSSNEYFLLHPEFYQSDILNFRRNAQKNGFLRIGDDVGYIKRGTQPDYDSNGTIRVLRSANIQTTGIVATRQDFVSRQFFDKKKQSQVKYNDILITSTGVGTLGRVLIVKTNEPYFIDGHITILRSAKVLAPEFIYVYLNSKYGQSQIDVLYKGSSGQIELYPDDIKEILIKKVSIQQQIVDLVNNAFELQNQAIDKYNKAKELLLTDLDVIKFNPSKKLCFTRSYKDVMGSQRLDAEYFHPKYDEIINKIKSYKNGYDILGNIVNFVKCIEPGSSEYVEDGVAFVRVSNLSEFEISRTNMQYVSNDFYDKNRKHQPQRDEILLSKDGSVGIAYHISDTPLKMLCSGGILRLQAKNNKVSPECLTLILNSVLVSMQASRCAGGALITHWLPDQIKNTLIPIPDNQANIEKLLIESRNLREKSKKLLELAKNAVELMIETSEEEAVRLLKEARV